MLRDLRPATEFDVFWEWVRAEMDSPQHSSRVLPGLDEDLVKRLQSDSRDQVTEEERARVKAAFWRLRDGYLGPFLGPSTQWSFGSLPVDDSRSVRVIRFPPFTSIAPTRRLEEFVTALDGGALTPNDGFSTGYRTLRPVFDHSRVRGRPVLVSERVGGPYIEAEGLTRLSIFLSRRMRGEDAVVTVPVLVGASPLAPSWQFY